MPKCTVIYILFKEYVDSSRLASAPCIHGEAYPLFQQHVWNELKRIFDIIDYFVYERTLLLYDRKNLEGLLYQPKLLPEGYPGMEAMVISQLQKYGLSSSSSFPAGPKEQFVFERCDVSEHLLGDMAQRAVTSQEVQDRVAKDIEGKLLPEEKEYEPCVLLHQDAVTTPNGIFRVQRSGGRTIELRAVSTIQELHQWLSENRFPKRRYCFNAKHGDAFHPAQQITDKHGPHPAAQLLTTEDETKELLKKAVGKSTTSELWYYDQAHACYIYFENQQELVQPSFHAYHLHEGEENFENIDRDKLKQAQNVP